MATSKNKADEAKDDTAKGATPAGEVETSTKAAEKDEPTSVQESGAVDTDGLGEVAGAVPYGESGFEDEFGVDVDEDNFPGALGTVQEQGYDVPWTYLTPGDFEDEPVRTADSDDGDVVSWNVQVTDADDDRDSGHPVALVPAAATPGQTFTPDELPNVESLKAAGINVQQFLSGLPVRPSFEGEQRRRGIPA